MTLSMLSLIPPFFALPPSRFGSQDEELHHVELFSKLKMKRMRNTLASCDSTTLSVFELLDPMCYLVLFETLLECEVLLYLELVEG